MGAQYSPKKGDRVRVVYEGIVTSDSGNGNPGFAVEGVPFFESDRSFLSVEKIEPPVEFFKEGDRLRRKGLGSEYEVTLGKRGYLHHSTNSWSEFDATDRQFFNSRNFELVYRP